MKDLKRIFNPKTVALIGASPKPNSVGHGLFKNLLSGRSLRNIYPINPNEEKILGVDCLPSIKSIPERVDLAIIAVPSLIVPQIVKESCQKKAGGIIVISSGFAEKNEKGKILQNKIKKMTEEAKIPLIGPNCLGIIRPSVKLNASFAPLTPKRGNIAFVSQSGALIDSIIDQSALENYGFSAIISFGNEAGLTIADFLAYLEEDQETKVIVLYLEGIKDGRRFMEVAKKSTKPIIAIKAGKTKEGIKAAGTHTGSLAGSREIYSAAFKQAGIIEVETLQELFDLAKALSWQPRCRNGIGIVTNGGGAGVLTADYCQDLGVNLPKIKKSTLDYLDNSQLMHPAYSRRNPLDIVGDALADRYQISIEAMLRQKSIYGLIVIQTLQTMTESKKDAEIIIEAKRRWKNKPIVCCFLGGKMTQEGVKLLEKNKIPNYPELKRAAMAIKALIL